ncbi:CRISPR-associated endonuclease Cas3'' [Minwuia thermotolerans]|uniref:CRISPR-associated endonuclease Cas3 n=2 Tax=Minwuia thermotolerans TaxID=2056226 RepID=A0A2M9G0I8_9PROT|nr:CRISPR-associated endonuclease Cas3'' [Minwuia thermotolerans]
MSKTSGATGENEDKAIVDIETVKEKVTNTGLISDLQASAAIHFHRSHRFFAHSTPSASEAEWHRLADHLSSTSRHAENFARHFAPDAAAVAGLLHDLGKYSPAFQARLRGDPKRVDHSTAGAIEAMRLYGPLGKLIAYAVAGHHAGLANGAGHEGERRPLVDRLADTPPPLDKTWQSEIGLPPGLGEPELATRSADRAGFQFAFLTRMLFSALVDADYLDTEAYYARIEGREHVRGGYPSLAPLREALDAELAQLSVEGPVNELRQRVLAHVRGQAAGKPGLFSLTVPTGGGKTLTSLAFALDHALANGLERIVYVAPFTSIIEQTARVFRTSLGALGEAAVLEHHSAFEDEKIGGREAADKLRLAMENWDAPVVVTTAVQFFESLFADRPSRCRKLHNLAGAVIVLDETQTLPLAHLRPCVAAIDELALNYRSSVVLCTATQPALNESDDPARSFAGGLRGVRELVPDPPALHTSLRRVTVRMAGQLDDEALAEQLLAREQVLCIVNNRAHARAVFERLRGEPGARHLTTLMYPRHRARILREVRADLTAGRPCRLVATSLIEAGVDVDFPAVFRAEAGIDSIAQAAGRCNREGRRHRTDSIVTVFRPVGWNPPPELARFAEVAAEVLRRHKADPLGPDAIDDYFRQLYWLRELAGSGLDTARIIARCDTGARSLDFPFESIAKEFRIIESAMQPLIVPGDERACGLVRRLAWSERPGGIARKLQPYVVQLLPRQIAALMANGNILALNHEHLGNQYLKLSNMAAYDPECGLDLDHSGFRDANKLVI